MLSQEDWWAVWLGLLFFVLGLLSMTGADMVGWVAYPSQWVGFTGFVKSVKPLGQSLHGDRCGR